MADASSVRYAATLPHPTKRNAGSIRYLSGTGQLVYSNGVSWELVSGANFQVLTHADALSTGSSSPTTDPVVGVNQWFIANRAMTISAIKVGAAGAGSSLASATLDVQVWRMGATSGTTLLNAPVDLTSATGTVVGGAPANQTLTATTANLTLALGDAVYLSYAATGKTAGQAIGGTTHVGTVTVTVTY